MNNKYDVEEAILQGSTPKVLIAKIPAPKSRMTPMRLDLLRNCGTGTPSEYMVGATTSAVAKLRPL